MKIILVSAIALLLICSVSSFAQDDAGKKPKKEDAHHHAKAFACDESCGFSVKSQDDKEVVGMVQMHAKSGCACCQNLSEEGIKAMMKEEKHEEVEVKKTIEKEMKQEVKKADDDDDESSDDE